MCNPGDFTIFHGRHVTQISIFVLSVDKGMTWVIVSDLNDKGTQPSLQRWLTGVYDAYLSIMPHTVVSG